MNDTMYLLEHHQTMMEYSRHGSNSLWEAKSIVSALGYTPAYAATYGPYTGATTGS